MKRFFEDSVRGLNRSVRDRAHRLLWPIFMEMFAVLIGVTGFGFLTASAFMALSTALGPEAAALFIGVGLMLLAGGLWALARKRSRRSGPEGGPKSPPEAREVDVSDAGSLIAFTAAFVLARILTGDKEP